MDDIVNDFNKNMNREIFILLSYNNECLCGEILYSSNCLSAIILLPGLNISIKERRRKTCWKLILKKS